MISCGFKTVSPIQSAKTFKTNKKILRVNTIYELVQGIGYIKFLLAQKGYGVAFRGQTVRYPHLLPSLYHHVQTMDEFVNMNAKNDQIEKEIIEESKTHHKKIYPAYINSFFEFDKFFTFPVLQHYGIETAWLDLVDNIWIALWFASHISKIECRQNKKIITYQPSKHKNCYIYLVRIPIEKVFGKIGVYANYESTLVDLRSSIPSYFIRPHMQHGLLLKKENPIISHNMWQMDEFVEGIIQIKVSLAHQILGKDGSVNFTNLFPSQLNDPGLKSLLKIQCLKNKIY